MSLVVNPAIRTKYKEVKMLTINGRYHMQVSDLLKELKDYPKDAAVYGIYHTKSFAVKVFHERHIYKTTEAGSGKEVYLYLGENRGSF